MSPRSAGPDATAATGLPGDPQLPRLALIAIAIVQSLLLLVLYRAEEADAWPSQAPLWSFPLWTLAIAVPLMLNLALESGGGRRLAGPLSGFAVLLAGVAAYTGFQATPHEVFPINGLRAAYGLAVTVACFKALMYLQQWAGRYGLSYPVLFTYSWRTSSCSS
jgi:hypothetical protein